MEDKKRHFWQGALCGALAMFLIGAVSLGAVQFAGMDVLLKTGADAEVGADAQKKLKELKKLVDEKYLYSDEVDDTSLTEGLYAGYINALNDPYSVYYDEEEAKSFKESTSGEYSGIGVVMSKNLNTNIVTAVQVYEDSPAETAGIRENDIIYKVNGEEVTDLEIAEVAARVKGTEGTQVDITLIRNDTGEEETVTVTRGKVEARTVSSEMKEEQIGYIRVTEFDSVTYDQFAQALSDLEAQGMEGLIVDLRNNPGGNLLTTANMLDLLLPEGIIVYTQDKNGEKSVLSSDDEHQFTKPLAVLVNGNSASASEIFAGAVQDYGLGAIVGTTTYGKGIVQEVITLDDGSLVKLTTAEYYTPNGRNIHKKGIEPDVAVEYEVNAEDKNADNQLDAAITEIKNKKGNAD